MTRRVWIGCAEECVDSEASLERLVVAWGGRASVRMPGTGLSVTSRTHWASNENERTFVEQVEFLKERGRIKSYKDAVLANQRKTDGQVISFGSR